MLRYLIGSDKTHLRANRLPAMCQLILFHFFYGVDQDKSGPVNTQHISDLHQFPISRRYSVFQMIALLYTLLFHGVIIFFGEIVQSSTARMMII